MRRFILLAEMHRIQSMLLESRVDFLRQNYLKKVADALPRLAIPANIAAEVAGADGQPDPAKVIEFVLGLDPDPTKKNSQWLLNLLLKGTFHLEDGDKATNYLTRFLAVKARMPQAERDLGRYKQLGDLFTAIEPYLAAKSQGEKDRELERAMYAQAEVLLNTPQYRILVPKTKEASCYFGVNTQWCTAATNSYNYFENYNKDGPLYIVLDKKNNRRWQFHFESGQFMDEHDRQINMQQFVEAHPEIAQFFYDLDTKDKREVGEVGGYVALMGEGQIEFRRGGPGLPVGGDRRRSSSARILFDERGVITEVKNMQEIGRGSGEFPFHVFGNGDGLIDILNEAGLKAEAAAVPEFVSFGVFYAPENGVWGTLHHVGRDVDLGLDDPAARWQVATAADGDLYALYSRQHTPLIQLAVLDGAMVSTAAMTDPRNVEKRTLALRHLGAFLLHVDVKKIAQRSGIQPKDFDPATAALLIEHKPHLADIGLLFKAKGGDDPSVRKKLLDRLVGDADEGEAEIPHTDQFVDGRLILHEYADWAALAEDNGGENAKWFIDLMSGEERFEVHDVHFDDDQRRDLLASLKPKDLRKIGLYLKKNYPDEVKEEFNENGDKFDAKSVADILRLHGVVEDDSLENAFDSAVRTGEEVGAEGEAYEVMKKQFKHNHYVFFKDGEALSKEFAYDTPCVVAAPIAEVVDKVTDPGWRESWAYDEKWLKFRDQQIDPQEPYYGFSGYDEEAAKERFAEDIHEFLD